MKFTGEFKAPRINLARYKRQLHEHLTEMLMQAALKWLEPILQRIGVWSGASHATFLALARQVGYNMVITPASGAPNRTSWGEAEGLGAISLEQSKGRYVFTYYTTLFYLVYNEYHNANAEYGFHLHRPGPYDFQTKGRNAFLEFASEVRLPDPSKAISAKSLRVS